jgi:hypothetical protein
VDRWCCYLAPGCCHFPIEIGLEQAPFVVFVYFFPHLNVQKTC